MGQSKLEPGSSMAVLCDLTRWKDPVLSGLVAGSGLLFLGALSCYSLIAVVAYFGLSLVLLGLGSKLYVHLMGLLKKPCRDPSPRSPTTSTWQPPPPSACSWLRTTLSLPSLLWQRTWPPSLANKQAI